MIAIFALTNVTVTKEQVMAWLEPDESESFAPISDELLASFLNGVIIQRRGAKDGVIPAPETKLNYNIILRKLKIAFDLKDDDILEVLALVDFRFSKHELSAFFRKPEQNQYRPCKDQILRNFIHGLQLKYRPKNNYEND